MWTERGQLKLLSEFKGPYTPTEDLLILSSAFSVVVSMILEILLLLVVRNKSKRTKLWIRYTLYAILCTNAAIAFAAFLYASANNGTHHESENYVECLHGISDDEGNPHACRITSRWLSLLISFFSTILMVSAWLDFREQDQKELETLRFNEESLSEKGQIRI
ncbi:uncharacterized protein F4822DRAFT_152357 [Hypoxylon trugodes]|uniref:uncharacterized protein n=1 Tax=Hypoxylon trugodes TaxID=326681 RepID=UPI00218E7C61|nr:uncharacterized protein F4822DRAFT_152357 [Hypoxylon trugodes]KAI1390498.1 hypothetical protein F4822DRAFT_152357 [Hypoxylon trugodes]